MLPLRSNYKGIKVDIASCDKEPIHIIGRIQSHGFFALLDAESLQIEQVSENIQNLVGLPPQTLLSTTLAQAEAPLLKEIYQYLNTGPQQGNLLKLEGINYVCFINTHGSKLFLEFEPVNSTDLTALFHQQGVSTKISNELRNAQSSTRLSCILTEKLRWFLGYDRVMIYKFDKDWNGHVIAESLSPGTHSYLNHHFPASDIPAQAREMLMIQQVRQIPDVAAPAIALVPYLNPSTGEPSNIIATKLRNPSELHLEYLANMGVKATLSLSILVHGKLWGIVTCHHLSPKYIDIYQQMLCESIVHTYSLYIPIIKEQEHTMLQNTYHKALETITRQLEAEYNLPKALLYGKVNIFNLTEATGAALFHDDQLYKAGNCPDDTLIITLADRFDQLQKDGMYYTDEVSLLLPEAIGHTEKASGVLVTEIAKYSKTYLLLFKPEIRQTITWAGKPVKEPFDKEDESYLHPRKSFERWEQVVENKSLEWTRAEIALAQMLCKEIITAKLRYQEKVLKQQKNKLQDFAYISSHNLRSPLNNFKLLLSFYKKDPSPKSAELLFPKLETVSNSMQNTLDELLEILRVNQEDALEIESLQLKEIVQNELNNFNSQIEASRARIITDFAAPVVQFPKVYLQSIMHNLISNALKYRHPDRQPEIYISSYHDNTDTYLRFSDNGLGINLNKHGSKIFSLYKTFHHHPEAKGIGLYLVKTQVESMGGAIQIDSEVNKGTTFTIQLKTNLS